MWDLGLIYFSPKHNAILLSTEGLAAFGVMDSVYGTINKAGTENRLIRQGVNQGVEATNTRLNEALARGWDGRLDNYIYNLADGSFIGPGGGKLVNTGQKDAITGDFIYQRMNAVGKPYESYLVIRYDGVQSGAAKPQSLPVEKVHKNSLDYVGDSHVYVIRDGDDNLYKIGESSQGVTQNGESIRAKAQADKLQRETGEMYTSEILKHFDSKRDAVNYQDQLRDRYRSLFGNDLLPGNREHLRGKKQDE